MNPRLLGVDQVRFRYTNRPHRHEGSNLDLQRRRLASCPLNDGGIWHLRQDSNPHRPGRNRLSCPLDDGGSRRLSGEPARIRTGDDLGCSQAPCRLGYELVAGDRGIEPRGRPGLEPSALPRASPMCVEPSPGVEPDPPPYQGGVPAVWTSRAEQTTVVAAALRGIEPRPLERESSVFAT